MTASSEEAIIKTQRVKNNSKRVLFVDDDLIVCRVLQVLLEYPGYINEEAENAVAALTWFDTRQADLVISDCHMPGIREFRFLNS